MAFSVAHCSEKTWLTSIFWGSFFHQVIDLGGEAISAPEYFHLGRVTEFKYGAKLGTVFRKWNNEKLCYTRCELFYGKRKEAFLSPVLICFFLPSCLQKLGRRLGLHAQWERPGLHWQPWQPERPWCRRCGHPDFLGPKALQNECGLHAGPPIRSNQSDVQLPLGPPLCEWKGRLT